MTLTSIEDVSVDEDFATPSYSGYEEDEPVMDVFGHEPFDELSMTLERALRHVEPDLGRTAQPGARRGVGGCRLRAGHGRPVLRRPADRAGAVAEVDGRLGLQLSRVMFGR